MNSPHRKTIQHFNIPGQAHELTFSTHNQQPFLQEAGVYELLAEALLLAKEKHAFHLWAYVFMPEHVHLLVWPLEERYSIEAFLKSIKQPVSRKVIGQCKRNDPEKLKPFETGFPQEPYHFWMPGSGYDRNITEIQTILHSVNYIHQNPLRRRLVEEPCAWKWSSAKEWEIPGSGTIAVDREFFPAL